MENIKRMQDYGYDSKINRPNIYRISKNINHFLLPTSVESRSYFQEANFSHSTFHLVLNLIHCFDDYVLLILLLML